MQAEREAVGPLTFLFTDIEGSTRMARALGPERWPEVLAVHHRLVGAAIEAHGGRIHHSEGDAFFAVFTDAASGVRAAADGQRALAHHDWPSPVGIVRVRMGVHTGDAQWMGDDYAGLEVHLAARIAAAAHGGQILVSAATRSAAGDALDTTDLGRHRLKDFPEPERLYHVVLGPEPPPPPRGERVRPTNLPPQLSRMIGRDPERSALVAMLKSSSARIVSLTGPGGVGKTRLAVAVGHELLDDLPGGVFIVRLAGIVDPSSVPPAIAEAMGIEGETAPPLESIAHRLDGSATLLILDNFEQLLSAADVVVGLAGRSEGLRLLITTQAPLRIEGERTFPLQGLGEQAAVELFITRAGERLGDFRPDPRGRARVAAICHDLDLLPLAIELAAARVGVLDLHALEERLQQPLALLTGRARDVPPRQRSLRATFEWTHALLTPEAQRLFARLGVCAGAVPLSMVEALATDERERDGDTLDHLDELLEFSLVRRQEHPRLGTRFLIPQALRTFALERLAGIGEAANARASHAGYLISLAHAVGTEGVVWHGKRWGALLAVADEVRPAITWTGTNEPDRHVAMCAHLARYWRTRAPRYEVIAELERARATGLGSTVEQAWLATHLSGLQALVGAREKSLLLAEEAVERWRSVSDEAERGEGLSATSWAYRSWGPLATAIALCDEGLECLRRGGRHVLVIETLYVLAQCLLEDGQVDRAGPVLAEAAELSGGDPDHTLPTVWADYALARGDHRGAAALYAESLVEAAAVEDPLQVILDLRSLTICLARAGAGCAALEVDELVRLIEAEVGEVQDTETWAALYRDAVAEARGSVIESEAVGATERMRALPREWRLARAIELASGPTR